jgi:hypothetical protein
MKKVLLFPLLCCLLFVIDGQGKSIIYVRAAATRSGDGSSWTNAYRNFQTGVNAAFAGDSVFVAGGTYRPASGRSFSMKDGVKIYGGFAGTETSLNQRRRAGQLAVSILKGNGNSVFVNHGLTSSARLDGFTITGGSGAPDGGGMNNESSSPVIANCVFSGNSARLSGGGMYNHDASPAIVNCVFSGNIGQRSGGGMFNGASSPAIINCIFSGNVVRDGSGGGLDNENASSPSLINCTIAGNKVLTFSPGGGIRNDFNSSPTLVNCIIYGNQGGIVNENGSTAILSYSLVQGWVGGERGNLPGSTNPEFISAPGYTAAPFTNGNYRLQPGSPLVNAGSNGTLPGKDTKDIAGKPRVIGDRVDMGVYENLAHQ